MMRSRNIPQPGWSFEYIMWIFTRISAITLIGVALIGLLIAVVLGALARFDSPTLLRWTVFPNPQHIRSVISFANRKPNWMNGFWQTMQMLIVFFGVSHGFNGLRVVIEDYVGNSLWRPLLRGLVFALWLFALIVAIFVIFSS